MTSESQFDINNHEDFEIIDSYISNTHSKSYILINGNAVYLNGGEDANKIYSEAVLLNDTISQNKKTILYSDSDCFLYFTNIIVIIFEYISKIQKNFQKKLRRLKSPLICSLCTISDSC